MFASRKAKLIAASGIIGLAGLSVPALSSSAFAANCPGNCGVAGSVTVPETLTLAVNFTTSQAGYGPNSFNLSSAVGNTVNTYTAGPAANLQIAIESNDPTGYSVDIQGPPAFNGAVSGDTFATDTMTYDSSGMGAGGTPTWTALPTAQTPVWTSTKVSDPTGANGGYDYEASGFQIQIPNVPADTYSGTTNFTLWGS